MFHLGGWERKRWWTIAFCLQRSLQRGGPVPTCPVTMASRPQVTPLHPSTLKQKPLHMCSGLCQATKPSGEQDGCET